MEQIYRILCPIDFSDASQQSLGVAMEWAQRAKAELVVLHVIPPYLPQAIDLALPVPPDLPAEVERRAEAESHLQSFVDRNVPREIPVRPEIGLGSAANEIVEFARQEEIDLVVMSTHGYSGWRHLLMGSVAEAVVRSAPCPVLTVGPNCLRAGVISAANLAAEEA